MPNPSIKRDTLKRAPYVKRQAAVHIAFTIAGAVALIAALAAFEAWRKRRTIEATFSGRPSLRPEQFYEAYFKENGVPVQVVTGVRSILEEELGADMSRLVDTDDFSKNLSFFWAFDSMADVSIVCALEEKFGIKISDAEAEQTRTVADIIALVQSKLGAHSAA
jgi:acyl carrier protein